MYNTEANGRFIGINYLLPGKTGSAIDPPKLQTDIFICNIALQNVIDLRRELLSITVTNIICMHILVEIVSKKTD